VISAIDPSELWPRETREAGAGDGGASDEERAFTPAYLRYRPRRIGDGRQGLRRECSLRNLPRHLRPSREGRLFSRPGQHSGKAQGSQP